MTTQANLRKLINEHHMMGSHLRELARFIEGRWPNQKPLEEMTAVMAAIRRLRTAPRDPGPQGKRSMGELHDAWEEVEAKAREAADSYNQVCPDLSGGGHWYVDYVEWAQPGHLRIKLAHDSDYFQDGAIRTIILPWSILDLPKAEQVDVLQRLQACVDAVEKHRDEEERAAREKMREAKELLELRRLLYKYGVPRYVDELLPMKEPEDA